MSLLSNFLKRQPTGPSNIQVKTEQILPRGLLLSDRYLIADTLGRGAMGEVYLAEDTVLGGVSVAVKVISQTIPGQDAMDKFAREAQIGAFLGHHNVNIVRVLDFGVHDDHIPFYVMEYVYGTTLADEIERKPLPLKRCIRLMSQVCTGLQSAHQGIVVEKKLYSIIHRDLKPANIFITENSSFGEIAKILDFGIAEFFIPVHKSTEAEAMGTLAYASGEQLLGKKLEPSADIYSFGITLFEAITGQLPIVPQRNTVNAWIEAHTKQPPRRLREVAPNLIFPEALETLLQKCLQKKPKQRPQMIQEVLDTLQTIADQMNGEAGSSYAPVQSASHDEMLDELFDSFGDAPASPLDELFEDFAAAPASPMNGQHTSQATRQLPIEGTAKQTRLKSSSNATRQLAPENQANATVRLSLSKSSPHSQASIERFISLAQQASWPMDKPHAEIVFAQSLKSANLQQAALWSMLNNAKLQKQALPLFLIEFAMEFNPHPMLAWVTILHDHHGEMRCLPCYLDLMDPQRQGLINTLVTQGKFFFMLFDPQDSSRPVHVSLLTLGSRQRQQLTQAIHRIRQGSYSAKPSPDAIAISKKKLKTRYQSLKSKLSQKLKA